MLRRQPADATTMEEEFNPYAAPRADAGVPLGPPRRPASVKWATFALGLMTAAVSYLYWMSATLYGEASVWNTRLLSEPFWLIPIGFVLCVLRRRDKVSFGLVALLLGGLSCRAVIVMLPRWTALNAFATIHIGERVAEILMTFGLIYLFYRFAFGVPSRRYFGMGMTGQREEAQRRA